MPTIRLLTATLCATILATVTTPACTVHSTSQPPPQHQSPQAGHRPPGQQHPTFVEMDKNRDGRITRKEVPADRWSRLIKADANGDGAVTKRELEATHRAHPRR